ncbi:nucleoside monophosphate kinase [uncultured Paludibaculum sp.]|uniref:adenylate kinase family protein n=1 Tax=uncultured Paludibaculum sp. TaxID=1765020 RepID=UPI002AAB64C0|nr:nucleoside monophosphate kinase [uncultured Paludibaculum sp.]
MIRLWCLLLILAMSGQAQSPGKGLVLVLIGPPGSGKTTQAEFLTKKFHISVLAAGSWMSDEQFDARLKILNTGKGFIIDGYPATHAQAQHLAAVVKGLNLPAPVIIQLDVPDDVVRQRMTGKEKPEVLEKRLSDYHKEMDLIRAYYPQADIWSVIGTRSPQEVSKTIEMLIQDRRQ